MISPTSPIGADEAYTADSKAEAKVPTSAPEGEEARRPGGGGVRGRGSFPPKELKKHSRFAPSRHCYV